jgi:hypothetical protein
MERYCFSESDLFCATVQIVVNASDYYIVYFIIFNYEDEEKA